jgi:hypothetical protein
MQRQMTLLAERYDLADRPASGVNMSGGKAVQEGVRVRLPSGITWLQLAALSREEVPAKGLWPAGFYPLPHPHHRESGMIFPQSHIDEIKKQTGRDLTRFDLDFDLPDHFRADFPPAIYLTTRPDLGDVSQGKLVISDLTMEVAKADGMLLPGTSNTQAVRAVFIIDPNALVRAILYHPLSNGRNMQEIKRLPLARQHSDQYKIATPANWQPVGRRDRTAAGSLRRRQGAGRETCGRRQVPRLVQVPQEVPAQ